MGVLKRIGNTRMDSREYVLTYGIITTILGLVLLIWGINLFILTPLELPSTFLYIPLAVILGTMGLTVASAIVIFGMYYLVLGLKAYKENRRKAEADFRER